MNTKEVTIRNIWDALSLTDEEIADRTFAELLVPDYIYTSETGKLAAAKRQYLISVVKIILEGSSADS